MTGEPIDPAVFANLIEMTGGEMEFVDELVDTFLEDGARQIGALQEAVAGGEPSESLVRPAHSLKSGSLNVGALGLGELSRSLEEAARSGLVSDAAGRVDAIRGAFAEVRRDLLAERTRRTSG